MLSRSEVLREQVQSIKEYFEVERCVTAMKAVRWKWWHTPGDSVTESEFRVMLEEALQETVFKGSYHSGGFHFWIEEGVEDDEPWLRICGGFFMAGAITESDDGVTYRRETGQKNTNDNRKDSWSGSVKPFIPMDDNDGWITDRLPWSFDGYNSEQFQDGDVWVVGEDNEVQLVNCFDVKGGEVWRPIVINVPTPYVPPRWKPNEGKSYWFIDEIGRIRQSTTIQNCAMFRDRYNLGNCFQTEGEAEIALNEIKQVFQQHQTYKYYMDMITKTN
jgi:hypothetical protein